MMIFFALAALVYFSFDSYILKPQREAMQERSKIESELKTVINTPAGPNAIS